ncbi:MAG: UDP-N-acetylmuramoyl-tripeptide--D-alanyl-D-alanine ligase [Burkholderiales bacterium]|nr:UDP-N-acetylmuramoyl-tripeptide--D-alanyl-D-alanine ligase [Phycisphaerae bacterium]
MKLAVAEIAQALGARAPGSGATLEGVATGYSVDSRTVEPGDLFFALRGPVHDGHDHVPGAFDRGAVAAVVERDMPGACLRVDDSLAALQRCAGWARERWGREVIGVTGSAGKTTTKDAIARMLEVRFRVGKTTGNFNNHVGVPLSLLRLPDDATHAVIELGMNHAGEIRDLAAIARPRVGVVTNVGTAHIENFESIEGVAAAKRELVEALPDDGVAVLNADDPQVRNFRFAGRRITYGIDHDADVRAHVEGSRFEVDGVKFESAALGRHAVSNLLAGIAVARAYDVPLADLQEPVRTFVPGTMRGTVLEKNGISVIDDCYNANPDAVRAMLCALRDFPASRHIAVLGEMLELGRWAEPLHRDIGNYVAKLGIPVLVGIRGVARHMVDAAIEGGLSKDAAFFFDDPNEAGAFLKTIARAGDAILFKGSRGTQVEKALQRFWN